MRAKMLFATLPITAHAAATGSFGMETALIGQLLIPVTLAVIFGIIAKRRNANRILWAATGLVVSTLLAAIVKQVYVTNYGPFPGYGTYIAINSLTVIPITVLIGWLFMVFTLKNDKSNRAHEHMSQLADHEKHVLRQTKRRGDQIMKKSGIAIGVIGALIFLFGLVRFSSAESQLMRAFGGSDGLGVSLLAGGGLAVVIGLMMAIFAPKEK